MAKEELRGKNVTEDITEQEGKKVDAFVEWVKGDAPLRRLLYTPL